MAHSAIALPAPVAFAPEPRRADGPVGLPAKAGWYSDPERRATTRFFDGTEWTEHTRGPAPMATLAEAGRSHEPVEARSYGRFENRPASAAIVVGAVSILVNPLFVTSTVAVLLGLRGLKRSGLSIAHAGRERALAGIALATIGMATAAVTAVAIVGMLTPSFLRAQDSAELDAVHAAVAQHVADRGAALASLSCPPPEPGATILCSAETLGHDHLRLQVVIPADGSAVQVTDQLPPVRLAPPPPAAGKHGHAKPAPRKP